MNQIFESAFTKAHNKFLQFDRLKFKMDVHENVIKMVENHEQNQT